MNNSYRWAAMALLLLAAGSAAAQAAPAPEPTLASLQAAARAHPDDGQAQYALGLALQKDAKHREATRRSIAPPR